MKERRQLNTVSIGRIRFVAVVILIISFIIVGRVYVLQVSNHQTYVERAAQQYTRVVQSGFSRGSIFMSQRDGSLVAFATMNTGYTVAMNPQQLRNAEHTYDALNQHISLDRAWFMERAAWQHRVSIDIAERVPADIAEAIRALRLTGISLHKQRWRYYPGNDLGAHTIGFIGFTDDDRSTPRGVYGLERFYNETLTEPSRERTVNLFAEIFSPMVTETAAPIRHGSIVTTLEPTVMGMLDRILRETHELYQSRMTGGIIIHPQTGAIYAMQAIPSFDLNNRSGVSVEQFRNPLVEDVYEMGSIMKALTLAAGLDAGVILPTSTYYDSGEINLDGFRIRNYDGRARGTVDMQTVISRSLNTGVAHIVELMGRQRFRDYFLNLRLGSESGIDLPSETTGLVANLQSPRRVEFATASFGQGIATTPIATARALSALGNGGYMVTPHLVSRINYTDGSHKDVRYPKGAQVWSETTSETVSRMLVRVVDETLRNGKLALPSHTVGAKTGTAQIARPGGGYFDDRYLHSFFGYFPAFDPQFLILLYTVEPKGVQYASETLTDPFMDMTRFLINYYNVPPDR